MADFLFWTVRQRSDVDMEGTVAAGFVDKSADNGDFVLLVAVDRNPARLFFCKCL